MTAHRCPPCSAAWLAWLDYKPPPPPIVLISPGAFGVREIQAAQQRRFEDWRRTVRFEQDLITRICAERHNIENLSYAGWPPHAVAEREHEHDRRLGRYGRPDDPLSGS